MDWRAGADHFESLLIDYDVCSNWGNWASVAGVGGGRAPALDFVKQARQYDADGEYVRAWLPELSNVPSGERVHEPWLLSEREQEAWDVRIGDGEGDDYPLWVPAELREEYQDDEGGLKYPPPPPRRKKGRWFRRSGVRQGRRALGGGRAVEGGTPIGGRSFAVVEGTCQLSSGGRGGGLGLGQAAAGGVGQGGAQTSIPQHIGWGSGGSGGATHPTERFSRDTPLVYAPLDAGSSYRVLTTGIAAGGAAGLLLLVGMRLARSAAFGSRSAGRARHARSRP